MNDDLAIAMGERLERIAVALERIEAILKPSDLAAFHQEAARTAPVERYARNEPIDPEPPFPTETLAPSAPVPSAAFRESRNLPAQPIVPQSRWAEGQVHAANHRPLKTNARGLFCPTKLENGTWCPWRP